MSEREDCEFYIPSLGMYGGKDGHYGYCSNREQFIHKKYEFSIYDHEICWALNPRNAPNGCGDCVNYKHKNIINQRIYLIRRILRTSGISNPRVWGLMLENWLHPFEPDCECNKLETGEKNDN
jgi:hypothetical protein